MDRRKFIQNSAIRGKSSFCHYWTATNNLISAQGVDFLKFMSGAVASTAENSLENYLNKLIVNDVRLLCDVRNNPLSRKYGFSKNQLQRACESIGIKYHHIPDLGIDSGKRNGLRSINDYNRLFDEFEQTTLVERHQYLVELSKMVEQYRRVAITCFEKEPRMCHRSRIANALKNLPGWDIPQQDL